MLGQYRQIKKEHQDSVLLFRLGDFYEMFAEDAIEVSALLNLTLTNRNGVPMCGVPHHAVQNYIARLLNYGKKIAVCEQVSQPGKTKLIDRKVVEIITPGTLVDENYLDKRNSNYLACLASYANSISFSYIDLSIGDFYATSFPIEQAVLYLGLELERLEIREIIAAESLLEEIPGLALRIKDKSNLVINRWADWLFDQEKAEKRLCRQFGTANLKAFGLEANSAEIISAGALLDYLDNTAKSLIPHVRSVIIYGDDSYTSIDESTQTNLELIRNLRDGSNQYTLFEILDETKTAMGSRLLRRRLLHPLKDLLQINKRLDLVEYFYRDQDQLERIRRLLPKIPDLERLSSRLAMDKAHGKDMVSIMNALHGLGQINDLVLHKVSALFESSEALSFCENDFLELQATCMLLEQGLCENPSILLNEGNLIRSGYNNELDELNNVKQQGRDMLENYLEKEKTSTGIANLKLQYNRLIGYYFEVSKINLSRVPSYFVRRQGIATGERFSTEELAKLESKINGASGQIIELEKKLFLELREKTKKQLERISSAARLIAELDSAQSLAWASTTRCWIRPVLDTDIKTKISEGRHPVVEAYLPGGEFIPNNTDLEGKGLFFALITGPNMAGKSTYLRQTALITIMAQMGSFVPAQEAFIGITDKIFCRVGASDNLARGESTFLVEMNETAHILHTATERSLVIMDEVGRGTGTNDGLVIAWAVCEYLLMKIKCRTLFATHFHELSNMEYPGLVNRSMEILEQNNKIIFLRKLKEGPTTESYGLYAAGLAGIPDSVLKRAGTILANIRKNDKTINYQLESQSESQSHLFLEELSSLDINDITPLQAINLINNWKKSLTANPVNPGKIGRIKAQNQKNASSAELPLFD